MRTGASILTLLLVCGASGAVAQDTALPPDRAHLLDMTMNLRFGCDPEELDTADGSSFSTTINGQDIEGRAVWAIESDGDLILMLGRFEPTGDHDGHCLIWMRRGGPAQAGTWPVVPVTQDLMDGKLGPGPFAGAWFAQVNGRTHALVPDTGTLVFTTTTDDRLEGTFVLQGWTVTDGRLDPDIMRLTGKFNAVKAR